MAQDKTLPYTAYLVEYHDGDKVCYDIASAPKTVDLFDYYWDNYKHGFKKWTQTEWYTNLKLEPDCLFKVSPKSDYLQYFYSINLQDSDYKWQPKKNVVYYNHNGQKLDTVEVLNKGKIL